MKNMFLLIATLFVVLCPLSVAYAMGGPAPSPTEEAEVIERIATQAEEAVSQEKYEMKVLMEIPWGSKAGELGVLGGAPAPFPDRLTVDGLGNIYIFDKCNNRINKYSKSGKYLTSIKVDSLSEATDASMADGFRTIKNDVDMGVDGEGNIYVLNADEKKIRKMDANGKITEKITAPERADYLRVDKSGKVEAMRYKDGKMEIFDVSSKKMEAVKGFKTPGGLDIVLEESKGVNEPRQIKILNEDGTLLRRIEVKVPYELYEVNYLGTDEKGNIYIIMQRQSDETKLKEIAPEEFKTIRLLGWYIRKYDKAGANMMAEMKYILSGAWIPGYGKCFSLDKTGNVYMLAMYGDVYGGEGIFRVFKWEKKK